MTQVVASTGKTRRLYKWNADEEDALGAGARDGRRCKWHASGEDVVGGILKGAGGLRWNVLPV